MYNDELGGDFFITVGDPNFGNINTNTGRFNTNMNFAFDTLGVKTDRFYIGAKSTRTEIQKINRWLASPDVGPTLMRLRLRLVWKGIYKYICTREQYIQYNKYFK